MATPIGPQDFSEIRWRGHWVWVPEQPIEVGAFVSFEAASAGSEAHALFRKTFNLEQPPERAPARITADSRYALFVNGREVSRGPMRSQPRRMSYDLLDLAPFLQAGQNTIAVYVKYYGKATSAWMPAVPNMTLGKSGVLVFEADLGAAGWLVSDASWKARLAEGWSDDWRSGTQGLIGGGVPVEVFDARLFAAGWQAPEFDDGTWGSAQLVPAVHIGGFARTQPPTDPYGPLFPRSIAQLGGERKTPRSIEVETLSGPIDASIGSPVRRVEASMELPVSGTSAGAQLPLTIDLTTGDSARLLIDMGVIVSGLVTFELDAPAGTVLDLAYMEQPLSGPIGMLGQHAGTRYVARGEHDSFEVFDSNGLRFAYILLHGAAGPVTLRSFAVRELVYPWETGAEFNCDDAELNRIYRAGIRTVQLNSHDSFLDCPTREQRAWVGDGVVHQMVHLATNRDWRLAGRYLTLGNSPRSDGMLPMSVVGEIEASGGVTIPDWALNWIHGVYNWYHWSGDHELIKELLPTVERILRWYAPYQTTGGVLKDVVEWNLVDWSSVSNADTSAVLTALWARGLREYAEMAAWLDENGSRRWAEGLYEKIRAGFEVFWDESRGSYVDHLVDGRQQPEMSQLAGAAAIISGLAPAERHKRIVQTITDPERLVVRSWTGGGGEYMAEKMEQQFRGHYEIDWDAEQQIVLAEPFMSYAVHDAVALAGEAGRLPDLYPRWSEFFEGGYDTIGECWGWGTHVHGWSCTPTRDMVFYTLGVTPAEPGYTRARVAPRLGRLKSATGSAPTPHGLISVEVTPGSVTVDLPVPVLVELEGEPARELPAGRHRDLARRRGTRARAVSIRQNEIEKQF